MTREVADVTRSLFEVPLSDEALRARPEGADGAVVSISTETAAVSTEIFPATSF